MLLLMTMKPIHFRSISGLILGLLCALLVATAQEPPPGRKQGDSGQLAVERDKEKEDQVAKLFDGLRAEAKLPQLKRIGHRAELEQSVCTSALTGTPSKHARASYATADPGSITPELEKIASFNKLTADNRPWYARYSVAVWRVTDAQGGNVSYRVGVGLYATALGEFVDCHFTDDVHYCGKWKESIARPCQGK